MNDVCIVGAGGIVGAAIARELTGRGLSVLGLEKHSTPCRETSAMNSRVIHSGFHETPGTLKAELAREGSRLIAEYAEERAIPLLRTGMLIAIPQGAIRGGLWKEAGSLWKLWRQGRRHNIAFRFIATPGGMRKIAPIRALGGIFIPAVSVIDLESFSASLVRDARQGGAVFVYGAEVTGIAVEDSHYRIRAAAGEFASRILINSAGLNAHRISEMAGGPKYEVEFIRGDYYELAGGIERWNIRTLVYPATTRHSKSKGVHFGPRTDGRLYIGPSATPESAPAPKRLFLEAARKFLPEIRENDLEWAYAGVRPKLDSDFAIRVDRAEPPLINLAGIDSPGLSSCMAIARYVARLLDGLSGKGISKDRDPR